MRYTLILDEEKEETIIITAHKKTDLIEQIEKLINNQKRALFGFVDDDIIPLELSNIYAFYTSDNKIYAKTKNETLLVRERLYQIEEYLPEEFIKINQGCIINMKKVLKFETSHNASIKVILKNGFSDYISRRELKNVKRRIGL